MVDVNYSGQPPWWVRIASRHETRGSATRLAFLIAIIGLLCLIDAANVSGSTSVLGRTSFYLQLPAGCFFLGAAIWYGMAIRWIDRKGQWGRKA